MANCNVREERNMILEQPKKKFFEKNLMRMATLVNDVMLLHRNMKRDDLYEILLCLYGPLTCEKAFESVEQLEEFISKYCPFLHIETVVAGANEKKIVHWDLAGDKSHKNGLDRMANGTTINQKDEESD